MADTPSMATDIAVIKSTVLSMKEDQKENQINLLLSLKNHDERLRVIEKDHVKLASDQEAIRRDINVRIGILGALETSIAAIAAYIFSR